MNGQSLFINCSASWKDGKGVQIVGGDTRGFSITLRPVDAAGAEWTLRVTTAADGISVTYEQGTAPGVWAEYTAVTGPGFGMDIQGGDAVHAEAIWFEGLGVDCVRVASRRRPSPAAAS